MMRKICLVVLLLISFIFAGSKKDKNVPPDPSKHIILTTWSKIKDLFQ